MFIFWFGVFPVPRVFSSGGFSSYDFPFCYVFSTCHFFRRYFCFLFFVFLGGGGTGIDDRFCGLV